MNSKQSALRHHVKAFFFKQAAAYSCRRRELVGVRLLGVACCLLSLQAFFNLQAHAQSINARISVVSLSPARLKVEGERAEGTRIWSFRNAYGSLIGLGERIENLSLKNASGVEVAVRKMAAGEYESQSEANRFSYEVNLNAPAMPTDLAHASWLAGERGFLMLGDLLPLVSNQERSHSASIIDLTVPANWTVATTETKRADALFEVNDLENAVFFAGRNLRERSKIIGALNFTLAITGDWSFADEDVLSMAADILKEHAVAVGGTTPKRAMLMLAPFPQKFGAERWAAETRGETVMLLSGQSPSRVIGLAQLSVSLTHELFHLWVPNALTLDGDYDWFYEGFTLYQALRVGVKLQYLTFQDYINSLGRAFEIYQSVSERDRFSLIEASRRRWSGAGALVYQKSLIVAFLYDLTLRQMSGGKRTLDDVYRSLFRYNHDAMMRSDGNAAALNALKSQEGMQDFTRRYIENAAAIDLNSAIAPFGLTTQNFGARTIVRVSGSLTRSQRDLLRKLGYNDRVGH